MKVAIISKFTGPGGVNEYLERLALCLTNAGHTATLIFLRGQLHGEDYSPYPSVTFRTGWKEQVSIARGLPILRLLLAGGFPDTSAPDLVDWTFSPILHRVLQRHDMVFYGDENVALFSVLDLALNDKSFAVVCHESRRPDFPPLGRMQDRLLKRAALVLSPSPKTAEKLRLRLGREIEFHPLMHPAEALIMRKGKYVLFDTRWTPKRHPQFALEIAEATPGVRFVMAGSFSSSEDQASLIAKARMMGVSDRIQFAFGLDEEAQRQLYREASAYIRWPETHGEFVYEEGIGFGVVKALEHACPVIVDKRAGSASLIMDGGNGFGVSPNPSEYAAHIQGILNEPSTASRLSRGAYETAVAHSIASSSKRLTALPRRP